MCDCAACCRIFLLLISQLLGTTLEIPDPDEGMEPPNRRYELFLRSNSGPIDVCLVSAGEKFASSSSSSISTSASTNVREASVGRSCSSMLESHSSSFSSMQSFNSLPIAPYSPNSVNSVHLPSSLLLDSRLAGSPSLGSVQSFFTSVPFSLGSESVTDASVLRAAALTRTASLLAISPKPQTLIPTAALPRPLMLHTTSVKSELGSSVDG